MHQLWKLLIVIFEVYHIPTGLGFVAKLILGFKGPKIKILGSTFAGKVEAVGSSIKSFKPGDNIFVTGSELGSYAEYKCRKTDGAITLMPENISHEQAASVPYGVLTALFFFTQ